MSIGPLCYCCICWLHLVSECQSLLRVTQDGSMSAPCFGLSVKTSRATMTTQWVGQGCMASGVLRPERVQVASTGSTPAGGSWAGSQRSRPHLGPCSLGCCSLCCSLRRSAQPHPCRAGPFRPVPPGRPGSLPSSRPVAECIVCSTYCCWRTDCILYNSMQSAPSLKTCSQHLQTGDSALQLSAWQIKSGLHT